MEIFDIVDEKGQPTGETVSRETAHREGIRHRTVHIWIVRKKDHGYDVLLQKRSFNKDSFPGKYDTSSAGHIHAGDEPFISGQRELNEELGISAAQQDLHYAGHFNIHFEKVFHNQLFKDDEIAFVYVYEKDVDEDTLTLQTEEVERVDWFDLGEVIAATKRHDERFCVTIEGLGVLENYLKGKK